MTMVIPVCSVGMQRGPADMERLLKAVEPAWSSPEDVTLDFTGCTFISANGMAVLTTLKVQRDQMGWITMLEWGTVREPIAKQLGRWDVASLFGESNPPWADNAIPLFHREAPDPQETMQYVQDWIVGHRDMPSMTNDLAKMIRKAFYEVFSNVFRHAESPVGGLAMGQVYPNYKEFQVCVWDGGVGMVRRVQGAGHGRESPASAIGWALQQGHSTAPDGPSGLGLYFLRQFVKVNEGTFRVYANEGCYNELTGSPQGITMAAGFPGTLIELKLKIRSDVTYCLE